MKNWKITISFGGKRVVRVTKVFGTSSSSTLRVSVVGMTSASASLLSLEIPSELRPLCDPSHGTDCYSFRISSDHSSTVA